MLLTTNLLRSRYSGIPSSVCMNTAARDAQDTSNMSFSVADNDSAFVSVPAGSELQDWRLVRLMV